jgi:hypothetical protein
LDFEAQLDGFLDALHEDIQGLRLGMAAAQGRNRRHEVAILNLFRSPR